MLPLLAGEVTLITGVAVAVSLPVPELVLELDVDDCTGVRIEGAMHPETNSKTKAFATKTYNLKDFITLTISISYGIGVALLCLERHSTIDFGENYGVGNMGVSTAP